MSSSKKIVLGILGGLLSVGMVGGCVREPKITATIAGTTPESHVSGTAVFRQTAQGVHAVIDVANVPPGKHGLHLHDVGNCGNAGSAAGGHFNPDKSPHGFLPKDGFAKAHAGDLGNITIDRTGKGHLELVLPGLTVTGESKYNIVGRSVILHEKEDTFGQPTGNAGSRIGCGVITENR